SLSRRSISRNRRFSRSSRSGLLRPLCERLDERARLPRQTLKIDAGNRCQRHLLISCLVLTISIILSNQIIRFAPLFCATTVSPVFASARAHPSAPQTLSH